MISQDRLRQTIQSLLDGAVPKNLNAESIANQLSALETSYGVELSEYGYVMYVLEHSGVGGIYHGRLSDSQLMDGYAKDAKKQKDDLPGLLVNAKHYAEKVFSVLQDPDMFMPRLEGMSFPYVLYILFTGLDQPLMVEAYKTETQEMLARYPGTLDALPENLKNKTLEALSADT